MIANGRFQVDLLRAGGLRDADFWRAGEAGRLPELLASLDAELRCPKRKNLATDHIPQYLFWAIMSGASTETPYTRNGVGSGGLAHLNLSSYDGDPTYTETSGEYYTNPNGMPGTVGSSGKRFINDHIETQRLLVWEDAHENRFEVFAKESLMFRERWLYLPSQGISNNIRSMQYNYASDADQTGSAYRGNFGRIRLRNERGEKVIINKTEDHVLFVELEFELVTV